MPGELSELHSWIHDSSRKDSGGIRDFLVILKIQSYPDHITQTPVSWLWTQEQ